jgi:hypothetical protein
MDGGWCEFLIQETRAIASAVGEDAVKSLLPLIRQLKDPFPRVFYEVWIKSNGEYKPERYGDEIDREVWKQAREALEDEIERLRIKGGNAPPEAADRAGAALFVYVADHTNTTREEDALAALKEAGFDKPLAWLRKQAAWKEHLCKRILEFVADHPDVDSPKQIADRFDWTESRLCNWDWYKKDVAPILETRRNEKTRARQTIEAEDGRRRALTRIHRIITTHLRSEEGRKCSVWEMRTHIQGTVSHETGIHVASVLKQMTDARLTEMMKRVLNDIRAYEEHPRGGSGSD